MNQNKKMKSIGAKAIGNRTVIGIICIIAALAIQIYYFAERITKNADN